MPEGMHGRSNATRLPPRAARVEVDLGAVAANLGVARQAVDPAGVIAVVKADAYGHGAVAVARELERLGVAGLAVARAGEAEELRRAGIRSRILLLGGPASFEELGRAVRWAAAPVLTRREQVEDWAAWRRRRHGRELGRRRSGEEPGRRRGGGEALEIVVEVDTGMSRHGVPLDEWPAVLRALRAAPELRLVGLMSHLAESELPTSSFTPTQERRFAAAVAALDAAERRRVSVHLSNSSGALRRVGSGLSAVRVGGALYGIDLAATDDPGPSRRLNPAMSVKAEVAGLREIAAGTGVGYRRVFKASRKTTIALVPVGYGDGFSTRFGGGDVLLRGVRCPIVGQVSMDSLTVDATDVPGVAVGDECVLLGAQGGERIAVAELAARAGLAPYEVCCGFAARLPHVFRAPRLPAPASSQRPAPSAPRVVPRA